MTAVRVDLSAAREVAKEMQRGLVATGLGQRRIMDVSKRAMVEAWRQAGEIIEALVETAERSSGS